MDLKNCVVHTTLNNPKIRFTQNLKNDVPINEYKILANSNKVAKMQDYSLTLSSLSFKSLIFLPFQRSQKPTKGKSFQKSLSRDLAPQKPKIVQNGL